MRKRIVIFSSLLFYGLGISFADVPRSLATDQRIQVVTYQKDDVVPIHGMTFVTTQVIFADDETILDVQGGDAAAWTINVDKALPNILNIKPTILDSHSNLSVITITANREHRYYHFQLTSNKTSNAIEADDVYALRFVYPDEEKAKLIAKLDDIKAQKKNLLSSYQDPKVYNWNYSFNGCKTIMPYHVFDDGKFTYLELRPNTIVPAIFAVNNTAGKESVVNFRREENTLVIQEIAPQFTLRAGKYQVASIFNNALIAHNQN